MRNERGDTVATAYGRVDRAALTELEDAYDTRGLLAAVDQLAQLASTLTVPNSLRETLLELHGMAHTVIKGAGISIPTGKDSLPEVAGCAISDIEEMISTLMRIPVNTATHSS